MTEAISSNPSISDAIVWIADDDESIRWVLSRALSRQGYRVQAFDCADALLDALDKTEALPHTLLTDVRMPGLSGFELLKEVKQRHPHLPVVVMTAFSDIDSAVSAFQGGAFEYLAKPFDLEKVLETVKKALTSFWEQQAREATSTQEQANPLQLVGKARAMQEVFRAIGRLSQSLVTVLLIGESGVGKEVVARSIYQNSVRKDKPFVAINMAAIAQELLESELFGYEKGAFTGATTLRKGYFEHAQGGTLFLDEIGDMPMDLQTRLLRVLSSGYFYRVGGHDPIKADVRVIAATNINLEEAIKKGHFREDLYHRLNVIQLNIPPLRERKEDIEPLIRYFLQQCAGTLNLEPKSITDEALEVISAYPFPGNVRELENLCQWLLVMTPGPTIHTSDLPDNLLTPSTPPVAPPTDATWTDLLKAEVQTLLQTAPTHVWSTLARQFESTLIETALHATRGKKIEAAEKLGVGRNTLTRKIQELAATESPKP